MLTSLNQARGLGKLFCTGWYKVNPDCNSEGFKNVWRYESGDWSQGKACSYIYQLMLNLIIIQLPAYLYEAAAHCCIQ